jgi:hypothetical protein
MRPNFETFDAQATLSFLVEQTTAIETTVYKQPLPDITYPDLVPLDFTAPPWATSVTYRSTQGSGQAAWFNTGGYDIPNADVQRTQFQVPVYMAAVGYEYDLEEISQAQWLGIPLTSDKAEAAVRAYQEFTEKVAFTGDTTKGFVGLINSPAVTVTPVTADGTGASALWINKSPAQILRDVNTALSGIYLGTNTTGAANTLLLPPAQFILLSTTLLTTPAGIPTADTLLGWLKQNNAYTAVTNQPLDIRMMRQLIGAGAGGTDRMVAYRKAPDVLKMHIPMPHRFFAPQQVELTWKVPGIFRLGGVDIRRPKEMGYFDGI